MMKKTLYLFPLLCLIGAPLAHGEVYFFNRIVDPALCTHQEDEAHIDQFAKQSAQVLLQRYQLGKSAVSSPPLRLSNNNKLFIHWIMAPGGSNCPKNLDYHSDKIQQPPAADFDTVGYYAYVLTQLYRTEARQRQMWGILENKLADAPDLLQRIRDNWQQLNSPPQPK